MIIYNNSTKMANINKIPNVHFGGFYIIKNFLFLKFLHIIDANLFENHPIYPVFFLVICHQFASKNLDLY